MIENKLFANGGLNQDVDENLLKPNEWEYALNIRNTDRQEFSDGVISNVRGNVLIDFSLPAGTNKCIGNYANEQTGMYYSFIWNSDGFHTITEYDSKTNTISKVLQSKTDTLGVDILQFQQYDLINGVGIIDSKLLYWTDGYNQPRSIDITKAKTGTYYTNEESISLAKAPPQSLIKAIYGNDPNTSTASNRLKSQLFQFRYLYIYEDNSRSSWSSCSKIPLPVLETTNSISANAYRNNHIQLQFDVGTKFVKSIEIAAKENGAPVSGTTNDWFSILTVDRDYAISSLGYDSMTNTSIYNFYNDGLYQSVDVIETDLQYDYVPLKSKTLEIVNGNVLVLGNNTEGYDNIPIDIDISVTYSPGPESDRLSYTNYSRVGNFDYIGFSGVPVEGDIVSGYSVEWDPEGEPGPIEVPFSYTATAGDTGSLINFANHFGQEVADSTFWSYNGYTILLNGSLRLIFERPSFYAHSSDLVTVDYIFNAPTLNNSNYAYKTNSKYQFGIAYYDEFNRSSYVQTDANLIEATSSWGAVNGYSPVINWQINHEAPEWATKYQLVRTEQLTHKNFLFWSASSVTANTNTNYLDLNINTFNEYNTSNPNSILSYEWSPGDRCTIHRSNGAWISGYDVQVVGYNTTSGVLTIQKNGSSIAPGTYPLLIEIYTPKTRINSSTEQFFYEFGESYSCSGGIHAVSSGSLSDGDIFVKQRLITSASSVTLEDPNFSDFYVSDYSSNGRTNIYAPQAKQLTLPTDIRYSDTYVPNTNINGLSRFYGTSYETYDRVNGSIQKLSVRDNYLITFQELKTGYIPINQSIIEDQGVGNAANVAISTKLLNKIRYFVGDYGIGKNPESFTRFAGVMYFADPNRNVIIKLSGGLEPISMIGMDSYFTKKISSTNDILNAKMVGSYDPRNDEYIISFIYPSGEDEETLAYNESINRWTTFYSFIPDNGGYIYNKYITHKDGSLYVHNVSESYGSFYGSDYPSEVTIVYNQSPLAIKSFLSLIEQSNVAWIPEYISTSLGQESSLLPSDSTLKEGVYFLNFLRDSNSPGGILNGDDLKGNWIKMRLTEDDTSKVYLLSVDVRHIPSYQGIK